MIIDTDEIKEEFLEEIRKEIQNLVSEEMGEYIAENEDSWDAIQDKVHSLVRETTLNQYRKELWEEFIRFKNEMKAGDSIARLEDKVDALAKNMDYLYLMIQEK